MNGPESGLAQTPSKAARIFFTPAGTLHCECAWTLDHLADLERQIDSLPETSAGQITCDAGAIDAMDTGGAWLLRRTLNRFEQRGCEVTLNALSPEFVALMIEKKPGARRASFVSGFRALCRSRRADPP